MDGGGQPILHLRVKRFFFAFILACLYPSLHALDILAYHFGFQNFRSGYLSLLSSRSYTFKSLGIYNVSFGASCEASFVFRVVWQDYASGSSDERGCLVERGGYRFFPCAFVRFHRGCC